MDESGMESVSEPQQLRIRQNLIEKHIVQQPVRIFITMSDMRVFRAYAIPTNYALLIMSNMQGIRTCYC